MDCNKVAYSRGIKPLLHLEVVYELVDHDKRYEGEECDKDSFHTKRGCDEVRKIGK
jgi:hypothetical protein